jgi:hypothetical protein
MNNKINTFIANVRHAARNGETVIIGGGEFSPDELLDIADTLALLVAEASK